MFGVTHIIDYEKTSIFYNDSEFIEFTERIKKENGDSGITTENVLECACYIWAFCDNLRLVNIFEPENI